MCRGRGISAHSRSIKVSGSSTTLVLPLQRRFNPEFSVGLANVQRRASWRLMIPPLPAIVGLHFYVQGYVFDFGANLGNAVVSNAGDGQIGV